MRKGEQKNFKMDEVSILAPINKDEFPVQELLTTHIWEDFMKKITSDGKNKKEEIGKAPEGDEDKLFWRDEKEYEYYNSRVVKWSARISGYAPVDQAPLLPLELPVIPLGERLEPTTGDN